MTGVVMVTLLLMSTQPALTGRTKLYHTEGTKEQSKTLEQTIFCDRKLLFEVKACDSACVMIKSKTSRDAVYLQLGKRNRLLVRTRSERKKTPDKAMDSQPLDCDKFKPFWIQWDTSKVSAGIGVTVGRNETIRLSKGVDILSADVQIFTIKQYAGDWKILTDEPPVFLTPPPGSAAQINVPEDTSLGKVLYHVEAHDPDHNSVTYDVIGDHKEIFQMKGSGFTVQKDLDYESERVYGVVIRARSGIHEVNTTLLVNVTNVHDEPPVIHLAKTQTVVEELPLGQPIPGVFTVTEKEARRGLNYRLLGEHKKYVGINTFTGDLLMIDRLDYENSSCPRVLDLLTLEVENVVGHKALANLSIKVINLNDNAPRFNETVYKVKVKEKDDMAQPLVKIRCEDPDREDAQNITLTVKEPELSSMFRIQRTDTTFELSFHDKVNAIGKLRSNVNLTLEARDSNTVIAHTATAQVIIDMSAVSNFTPAWLSPFGDNTTDIPDLYVPEDHPINYTITTFTVNWTDSNIVYKIESVLNDLNETAPGVFITDPRFGNLMAVTPLDCDFETGGVDYYTITVRASLLSAPNKFSERQIRLYIDDVDDNAPIFSEGFYYVPSGCEKFKEVTLLTFNVTDYDVMSNTMFTMAENASQYTVLDSENGSIILLPSPGGTIQRWDTFEVLEVTAHDVSDGRLNATTNVMVYYENCSPGAQRRRRLRGNGVSFIPRPSRKCEVKRYVKDKTVEDYIFKAMSGILGLILVCIAAFYLSKRTVFKNSSPSVNPLAEVQDDEDDDQKDRNHREGESRAQSTRIGHKREEKSRHKSGSELTSISE